MKTQWLKKIELEELQLKKLKKLMEHCYENNEFYREKFKKIGFIPSDIKTLSDLQHLPIITKTDLRQNYNKVISKGFNKNNCYISHTSGSSGEVFTTLQNPRMYHFTRAFTLRMYLNNGIKLSNKMGLVTHGFNPMPKNKILKRLLKVNYFPGNLAISEIWNKILEVKPQLLQSYAGIMLEITKMLENGHLSDSLVKYKPKLIVVVGEPSSVQDRELIEGYFNTTTLDAYPCMELNLLASECKYKNGLHINSEANIIEIISDGKNVKLSEKGEVVITNLENYAMPFIRYNIKDISSLKNKPCPCGRELPLLDYVEGRCDDVLTLPSGKRIQPGQINAVFMSVCMELNSHNELLDFFVVQNSLENITVKLRIHDRRNKEIQNRIFTSLNKLINEPVKIDMEIVDRIERKVSHKRRKIMSNVI